MNLLRLLVICHILNLWNKSLHKKKKKHKTDGTANSDCYHILIFPIKSFPDLFVQSPYDKYSPVVCIFRRFTSTALNYTMIRHEEQTFLNKNFPADWQSTRTITEPHQENHHHYALSTTIHLIQFKLQPPCVFMQN